MPRTTSLMTLLLALGCGIAPASSSPRVFTLEPGALVQTRVRLRSGDPRYEPAMKQLRADADRAMKVKPVSVMDKTRIPPSGDKHDYMSVAPYFWPNPDTKDGLPYIHKDGEHNPEASNGASSDSPRFGRMGSAVETLSLAWYLTGRSEYGRHAASLLRTWFLDSATRMNPNLNFGQGIPGKVSGRGIGIIETARLIHVVDSVGLLGGCPAWSGGDQRGMIAWMREYLDWLQHSKNGRAEAKASNNHGSFYDAQVTTLALFTGQRDLARTVLLNARSKRIASQIEADGRQPRELARTKSFSYSTFNLDALEDLAALGERVGVDLWGFQAPDGGSIRKALDFLAPYAQPRAKWPYKQITRFDRKPLLPLLWRSVGHFQDPTILDALIEFPIDARSRSRLLLTEGPVSGARSAALP